MKANPKFDIATCKKLLGEYAKQVNHYIKDNESLKTQLEDAKTTLMINKTLLYEQMGLKLKEKGKNILKEMKTENAMLIKNNETLIREKVQLSKKLYNSEQELIELSLKYKDQLEEADSTIFLLTNAIKEKDALILHFEKELHKYYKNDYQSEKEIIITVPEIANAEMNNELCLSRQLIIKYSKMVQDESKANKELNDKITLLNNKIEQLKRGKKISEKIDNIEQFGYLMSSSSSSSSEKSNKSFDEDKHSILESPTMEFPSKIKMSKYLCTETQDKTKPVPKLNLTKVMKKYVNGKNDFAIVNNTKKSNGSNEEYISKIKYQLKMYKNLVIRYKKKFIEMKKIIQMVKQNMNNSSMNNSIIYGNNSIDANNSSITIGKKCSMKEYMIPNGNERITNSMMMINAVHNTQHNHTNNSWANNDSMCNNFSIVIEDASKDPEDEFNYIIKEYSRPLTMTDNNN